jgi:hypothetical protein
VQFYAGRFIIDVVFTRHSESPTFIRPKTNGAEVDFKHPSPLALDHGHYAAIQICKLEIYYAGLTKSADTVLLWKRYQTSHALVGEEEPIVAIFQAWKMPEGIIEHEKSVRP